MECGCGMWWSYHLHMGCMCTKEEEIEIVAGVVRVMSSGESNHRELEKSRGTFRVAVNILVSYLRRIN